VREAEEEEEEEEEEERRREVGVKVWRRHPVHDRRVRLVSDDSSRRC